MEDGRAIWIKPTSTSRRPGPKTTAAKTLAFVRGRCRLVVGRGAEPLTVVGIATRLSPYVPEAPPVLRDFVFLEALELTQLGRAQNRFEMKLCLVEDYIGSFSDALASVGALHVFEVV